MATGADPGRDHDLLHQAAYRLVHEPNCHFRHDEAARHTLAGLLQHWASEIECGTAHPAVHAAAIEIAHNVLNDEQP